MKEIACKRLRGREKRLCVKKRAREIEKREREFEGERESERERLSV